MNQTTKRLNTRITTNRWKTLKSLRPTYIFLLSLHGFFQSVGNDKEIIGKEGILRGRNSKNDGKPYI